jgi:hypothetical protein
MLISSWICHFFGILFSLGGLMIENALDLALYNTSSKSSYSVGSHQYFCLIMIVLGILGIIICILYVVIIEIRILRESRSLNAYLENPSI